MPVRVVSYGLPNTVVADEQTPFSRGLTSAGNTLLSIMPQLAQIRADKEQQQERNALAREQMGMDQRRLANTENYQQAQIAQMRDAQGRRDQEFKASQDQAAFDRGIKLQEMSMRRGELQRKAAAQAGPSYRPGLLGDIGRAANTEGIPLLRQLGAQNPVQPTQMSPLDQARMAEIQARTAQIGKPKEVDPLAQEKMELQRGQHRLRVDSEWDRIEKRLSAPQIDPATGEMKSADPGEIMRRRNEFYLGQGIDLQQDAKNKLFDSLPD